MPSMRAPRLAVRPCSGKMENAAPARAEYTSGDRPELTGSRYPLYVALRLGARHVGCERISEDPRRNLMKAAQLRDECPAAIAWLDSLVGREIDLTCSRVELAADGMTSGWRF